MIVEEVETRLDKIIDLANSGDDEGAHVMEDLLYSKIVFELATSTDQDFTYFDLAELVKCAQLAISSKGIKFERWCA